MGDLVLEDFRGKDCAFVADWLLGKGLNKLFMFHDEEKLSIQWSCSSDFRRFAEAFVRSKYANSVPQFLLYL